LVAIAPEYALLGIELAADGQKLGAAAIVAALMAIVASAATLMPRFAWVESIAAPIGVFRMRPSSPSNAVIRPTADWLQCCCVITKNIQVWSEGRARRLSENSRHPAMLV
jgi:hypothetical protein